MFEFDTELTNIMNKILRLSKLNPCKFKVEAIPTFREILSPWERLLVHALQVSWPALAEDSSPIPPDIHETNIPTKKHIAVQTPDAMRGSSMSSIQITTNNTKI